MKKILREWIVPLVIALVTVILLNTYVFILPKVPSESMMNTIMIGDRLYVNKMFDVDKVRRGDILVFKSNYESNKMLVKRLIGLPGETVDIKTNGEVYIDGEKIEEPYAIKDDYKEQTFIIPENSYFFLGDNRPNSGDSRYWENPFINKKDIIGKAIFRIFPFSRIGKIE